MSGQSLFFADLDQYLSAISDETAACFQYLTKPLRAIVGYVQILYEVMDVVRRLGSSFQRLVQQRQVSYSHGLRKHLQ